MTDTMALWDAVSKTNPANTKKVNQRGGFTAINAHSQVMEATRQFGPIGIGWGYDACEPIFHDALVVVPVLLWHGERRQSFGPIYGAAEWRSANGRLDSDALKKAATDGLTKGLSLLGFNADVFLGLYDDNKYVEAVAQEFEAEKEPAPREKLEGPHPSKTALRKAIHDLIGEVRKAQSGEAIDALLKGAKATIEQASAQWPNLINGDPKIEEDTGLKGAVETRRAEVANTTVYSPLYYELVSAMKECNTLSECTAWNLEETRLDELDDAERREFEAVRDQFEAGLMQAAAVRAG